MDMTIGVIVSVQIFCQTFFDISRETRVNFRGSGIYARILATFSGASAVSTRLPPNTSTIRCRSGTSAIRHASMTDDAVVTSGAVS